MKYLVFQHVAHEPLGLIADTLKELRIDFDVVEFWNTDAQIPETSAYDGLIIMGGPMGVYEGPEKFPSKEAELKVIREFLDKKKPIIGFCLGAQLLSYVLGGKVYQNIKDGKRLKEIGYYTVDLTKEGEKDPLLSGFPNPMEVFQFHGDAFDVPQGAVKLASSERCDNQAIRVGNNASGEAASPAYGFLFHVEVKPELIKELVRIENKWIHEDFDMDEDKLLKQAEEKASLMREQCKRLFTNFKNLS